MQLLSDSLGYGTRGYAYTSGGQAPPGSGSPVPVTSVGHYDSWGNRDQLTFASGARSQWTSTMTGVSLQNWTVTPLGANAEINGYSQDANGNLSQGGGWSNLTHDAAGRLTAATGFGESVSLSHDGFGNNLANTMSPLPMGANNFGFYSMPNNQTPSLTNTPTQSTTGWAYQGNGEATQIGTATGSGTTLGLNWDGLGRMNNATLNGQSFMNTFAPTGLRVKLTDSLGTTTRSYTYTSGGLLLGEYDGNSAWKRDVIYIGGEALAEIDGNGTHELHNDPLGSPRVITSRTTGAVEGRQVFGPYGERLPSYTNGYQPLIGYTGHAQQEASGLIYMRGRFYTPSWHRFLNSDQGMDPSTFNQMAYVGGSPFQAIDPSGMAKVKKGAKAWTKDRKLVECTAEGGCDTGSSEGWVLAEAETGSETVEVTAPLGLGYQYAPAQTNQGIPAGYTTIVVPNLDDLVGHKVFGTGTCVDLAKAYGAPRTALWVKGPVPNADTPDGTLVATFYANSGATFANQSGLSHVGAWDGIDGNKIVLVDQYRGRSIVDYSYITYGGTRNYNSNANNYFIVLIPGH